MKRIIKKILYKISPLLFCKISYYKYMGKKLDLEHPKDFNEKLQYLKFHQYYNNEKVTNCIDKYLVKEILEKKGMGDMVAGLYGVYDSVDEIPWQELPQSFVIKCNHGCGMNILCPDREKLDIKAAKKLLDTWMHTNYAQVYGEVQYQFIKRKILIEQMLDLDMPTYKFYCFHGKVEFLYRSSTGKTGILDEYLDFFDKNWKWLDIRLDGHIHSMPKPEKPKNFEKMIEISEGLSAEFPFVRVDLYSDGEKIYFSELTFIPTGGFMKIQPMSYLDEWGRLLEIAQD